MFRFYTGDKIYRHAEGKKKKYLSQHSQGSLVWLKQTPQEMEEGAVPVVGRGQRRLLGVGTWGAPRMRGSRGVEGRHPGGQQRLLGTRTTLEGPHWEQTSPRLKDFCSFFKCLLNSALPEGVCQVLQGVGDKIRKMIGSLAFLLNNRKPLKVFWVLQWLGGWVWDWISAARPWVRQLWV